MIPQGELTISSGRVTIVDPGYTFEHYMIFNHDFFRRLKEPAFLRLLNQPSPTEIAIIQGRKAIYLGNFGGDGDYPIIRTDSA